MIDLLKFVGVLKIKYISVEPISKIMRWEVSYSRGLWLKLGMWLSGFGYQPGWAMINLIKYRLSQEQLFSSQIGCCCPCMHGLSCVITLRPRQNGRRFTDDTFKRIFLNKNVRISIKISLKFVPRGPINANPSLVQIMVWHRSGDKPLSEPMMVSLLTHICVTWPQWVNVTIVHCLVD